MITGRQIAAARTLLGWKRDDLEKYSGISADTVKKIEEESTRNPRANTINPIIDAFERHGVEFIDGGVREKQDIVEVLSGDKGIIEFYNRVAAVAETEGGEFLVYGVDEKLFDEAARRVGILDSYVARMKNVMNITFKVLISADDENEYGEDYCHYAALPPEMLWTNASFYIYGKNLALIVWSQDPKFIVLKQPDLVEAYKRQFYAMWQRALKK